MLSCGKQGAKVPGLPTFYSVAEGMLVHWHAIATGSELSTNGPNFKLLFSRVESTVLLVPPISRLNGDLSSRDCVRIHFPCALNLLFAFESLYFQHTSLRQQQKHGK